jgi:hypothetical protein
MKQTTEAQLWREGKLVETFAIEWTQTKDGNWVCTIRLPGATVAHDVIRCEIPEEAARKMGAER